MCVGRGGGQIGSEGGGQIGSKVGGGGANWPKVVFLFLVQSEKCVWGGGGANDTLPPPHF